MSTAIKPIDTETTQADNAKPLPNSRRIYVNGKQAGVRDGLSGLRREWILARGDVEEYEGRELKPIDDGYLTFDAANKARVKDVGRLEDFPALQRKPLRAR